jgi:ubiquinone biosynthesis protein UbiJ
MSLAAAQAMRDLADCLQEEADALPPGMAFAAVAAQARAHRKCADRIEARCAPAAPPPPAKGGARGRSAR